MGEKKTVSIRPTRAELDLGALNRNLATLRTAAPGVDVLAVVKADAYGHGAVPISRALEAAGVRFLGVALVEEGLALREAGLGSDILVLGGAYDGGWEAMLEHGMMPVVFRPEHLTALEAAARAGKTKARAHMKVDTGMGRLGVLPADVPAFLEAARACRNVSLEGLCSHFANADLADAALTELQVTRFRTALAQMRAAGFDPRWRHLSNSAGLLALPEARDGVEMNLARPGLGLYGLQPAPWLRPPRVLEPVLSWKTVVVHLKSVPTGTPISYGSTWTAPRPSRIATLPVGYADGWSRLLSNRGTVLVRGHRAPVVGRVCMDLCMVDVTDIPGAEVGDEVVLIGRQGAEVQDAHQLAALQNTIAYDVLCAIGARVPRVAVGQ
ncbi:MAG TPA: alanine racemase [Myxococcaceae bacterium]|nr:alanine racemase [Myxococcaceae bacterium]